MSLLHWNIRSLHGHFLEFQAVLSALNFHFAHVPRPCTCSELCEFQEDTQRREAPQVFQMQQIIQPSWKSDETYEKITFGINVLFFHGFLLVIL